MKYSVEVYKTTYAVKTIEVTADSPEEACAIALDKAEKMTFSSVVSEFETDTVEEIKPTNNFWPEDTL